MGETPLHRAMVSSLIQLFRKQQWQVTAAASSGFPEPHKLGRHEPDVLGRNHEGTTVIGEVKTGEGDLETEHSKEQYLDFAGMVMTQSRKPCPFYLSVPSEHQAEIARILRGLGLLDKPNIQLHLDPGEKRRIVLQQRIRVQPDANGDYLLEILAPSPIATIPTGGRISVVVLLPWEDEDVKPQVVLERTEPGFEFEQGRIKMRHLVAWHWKNDPLLRLTYRYA